MKKQDEDIEKSQNEKMTNFEIFLHKWPAMPKAWVLWHGVEANSPLFGWGGFHLRETVDSPSF